MHGRRDASGSEGWNRNRKKSSSMIYLARYLFQVVIPDHASLWETSMRDCMADWPGRSKSWVLSYMAKAQPLSVR